MGGELTLGELERRQSEGTPVSAEDVRYLLIQHGFKASGSPANVQGGLTWNSLLHSDISATFIPRDVLDPNDVTNVAIAIKRVERRKHPKQPLTIPYPYSDLNATYGAYTLDKETTIHDKDFPCLFVRAQGLNGHLKSLLAILEEPKQQLVSLKANGLRITDNDDSVSLVQPDLNIKETLDKHDKKYFDKLKSALEEMSERTAHLATVRMVMVGDVLDEQSIGYSLESKGFEEAVSATITSLKPPIKIPVYGKDEIIPQSVCNSLFALLDKKPATSKSIAAIDPETLLSHPDIKPVTAQLLNSDPVTPNPRIHADLVKADLVFDASTLLKLATQSNPDPSFISLILHVATLPTVNSVVIPSTVADWELRGMVPVDDKGELIDVCSSFNRRKAKEGKNDFDAVDYIMRNATRIYSDENGKKIVKQGTGIFKKIVIYDSAGQHKALDPVLKIHKDGLGIEEKMKKLREFRDRPFSEGGGKDLGENTMLEYINKGISKDIDAYLISDDAAFRDQNEAGIEITRERGRINLLNTRAFIAALCDGRRSEAAHDFIQCTNGRMTADAIIATIEKSSPNFPFGGLREFNSRKTFYDKPIRLCDVVNRGVALVNGQNGIGTSSGKSGFAKG